MKNSLPLLIFSFFFAVFGAGLYLYSLNGPRIIPAPTVQITIPEGFNIYQIATTLDAAGVVHRVEFLKEAANEEGLLFPDTYEFFKDSKPKIVIAKMKDNFKEKAGPIERDIVIMASLLEEEAASEKDRKLISGILWERLDIGMLLQVDATLTYITGKSTHKLTDADLLLDDPYNTYKYKGLPAGPISNPGLVSIDAAVNPTKSQYLYYLSDSKGVIHYAKTFEEHKLNKEKYLY